ncbi:hypothetical protein MVEN_01556600 [Mycena venus]|uniref:Uncharacterized protein n=1 Tax=Mycena venus TaxID=2733690 RepID=A0A8H7CRC0_9AGAR|nr:hypothetical protein MVEN_01556600 [Mycena venus]
MVVTRKTPVAPVPTASRTNSSQPLPRAAKPKTTSQLAETEKEAAQTAAKNAAAASSPKPHPKSRHKNRHHKKPPKPSSGWLDRLVYLALSLLALYAFTTCPHDPALSNPVCRSLSQYRVHVLEPYVLPPIYRALEHPSVAPYVEKAQHIERTTLRPAYQKSAPYVAAAKRAVWDRTLVPMFYTYVAPQYRKHVLPQWRKHAAPHLARAAPYVARAQHTMERTAYVLHKTYSQRVAPAVSRAYAVGKPYVIKGYHTVRPHVVAFYVVVADKAGAARRAYVDPHVVRIWEKVLELSGAGPVGSPTEQPVPVPEKEPETTAASAEDSTTEVASQTSVKATVTATPVEASSVPAPSAEEEVPVPTADASSSVVPVKASSSSVVPVEASSVVPPVEASSVASFPSDVPETTTTAAAEPEIKEAIIEDLSAASIAIQSAHGMESPVVEDILADVESLTSVSSTPTSSASVHTPIATESEPAAVDEQAEDDSELFGFLDDIGLSDEFFVDDTPFVSDIPPDSDEDIELTPDEIQKLKEQEAAEQAAAKARNTREKRADLEGRMAKSRETLGAMVNQKNKVLRKMLVGVRKAAVSKMDDPRTEVGGSVRGVRKEGDKMLAGLEGYLKKAKASKGGDSADKMDRWETVVKKVEEKLGESIQKAQSVLQAFHAEEKAQEVDEGMAIIQEVKDACSQAQGDVGLELSWLDDVTYMDWQVYHDLAKIGEDFQAEASAIQGGTHANPPVDPFLTRLEEMQTALGNLVNELVGQINALRQQAKKEFNPEPEPVEEAPPAPGAGEAGEGEDGEGEDGEQDDEEAKGEGVVKEPKEPEVSILPVPPAVEPGVVDPAQVIIGKSAEQVKEAVRIAEEHGEL